jgi:hypothetical protein
MKLTNDDVATLLQARQRLENAAIHLRDAERELDGAAFMRAAARLRVVLAFVNAESAHIDEVIRSGREPKGGL